MAARKLCDEKQDLPEHKLLNTINLGWSMESYSEVFESFCIFEQVFKKQTGICSSKIDGKFNATGCKCAGNFFKAKEEYKLR